MAANPFYGPARPRKKFVLCFDGTGNKFSGTDADSNILKIYRMLDRSDPNELHYYQPGIGTYVGGSMSHTSWITRFHSWAQKQRDSMIGTSFDEHVMGGYKFLMRYYSTGDDIYFFGFSRGAYIARFLAEMLDFVGLLSAGNEEMARFAWKAFAAWQQRQEGTEEDKIKKKEMFKFLTGFRETFSRPVRRIRFLGLFDTVNSVPRFENSWMQRSKFPYTARSSALVIRHAVGIDERRAKFRQDLISETKTSKLRGRHRRHASVNPAHTGTELKTPNGVQNLSDERAKPSEPSTRYRRPSHARPSVQYERQRSVSPNPRLQGVPEVEVDSVRRLGSDTSLLLPPNHPQDDDDDDDADEAIAQDIQEIWFPGCHADIGGGWKPSPGEKHQLSHGPLVWITREAQKAGLRFDHEKMLHLKCCEEQEDEPYTRDVRSEHPRGLSVPQFRVKGTATPDSKISPNDETAPEEFMAPKRNPRKAAFHEALITAATQSRLHDCLEYGGGLPAASVLSWKIMEWLPFKRMDLQPDNSWKSISWPLPKGEVRDIPEDAWIHVSAIRRMKYDETYRPGNLIVGGGGRGVRIAPKELGIGQWEVFREEGDPVGEVYLRKRKASTSDETG